MKRVAVLAALALFGAPVAQGQVRSFLVSDSGVGGITSKTPYAAEALSARLGGLSVKPVTIEFVHTPVPALEATRNGKRVLLAFERDGDIRVSRIVTYAPESATTTGVKIGTTMARIFNHLPNANCRDGMDREAGLIFCPAPSYSHVRYVFRCPSTASEDPKALAQCPLEAIIWLAPSE